MTTFEPVVPFEPVTTETIPQGEHWIAQIKWDGVRVLTYYDGTTIELYNRKKNKRTDHYPELHAVKSYCRARSMILDGEVIALGNDGKPSFHEVMRRDGIRRLERVPQIRTQVPITYMVFDVLYVDGTWVHKQPLRERTELLSSIIQPNEHVQLVKSSGYEEMEPLYEVMEKHDMEGIVLKDLRSSYGIGQKNDRWQKKKNYKDLIAVVGGVTLRQGIVNALLLGLYDEKGQFTYIGHAGTGKLKKSEWRQLTETIRPLATEDCPFAIPPGRHKDAVWLQPKLTAKIQFIEWTDGGAVRQPSIQAFMNVPARECRFEQTKETDSR
ncbi:MAG TPA: RNA ligase family protein [Bacillales bacterium]|nr:RNA ligase family protein [Bacillales bacterium]